jgi:undecaprenyl-diphosphatase
VVALIAVALFGLLTLVVVTPSKALLNLDATVTGTPHAHAVTHAGFTRAMQAVSDIGSGVTWWIALGGVGRWLAWNRRARLSLLVIATGVGGAVINMLIKSAVIRARPTFPDPVSLAAGRSFPSGHTQAPSSAAAFCSSFFCLW